MPNDPSLNSVELISRIARQDRDAFKDFYDAFASLSYTFALRILRSKADAEDLVQEVFLQVWRQAGNYNPKRGKPEAWIITITKSRAIDKIRSQRRRDMKAPQLEEAFQTKGEEMTVRGAADSEVRLTVEGALDEISEVQKAVLELAYFEGLTQTEIAERLKIPIGTVKTRIRDGLKHLRGVLKLAGEKNR
jgi:RNA polymerase sigma-70 factor, ECF subfamily